MLEFLICNRSLQLLHKSLVIMEIMDGVESGPEHFTDLIQMPEISTTVILAGIAITFWIEWIRIVLMLAISNSHHPL